MRWKTKVSNDVMDERFRQIRLYGEQQLSDGEFLAVLVEEVGEVAQSLQVGSDASKPTDASNTYEELIQVSAVAQKWAEKILKESQQKQVL